MIRFPIDLIYNERNDNSYSEDAYIVLASGQRRDLGLKQVTPYHPTSSNIMMANKLLLLFRNLRMTMPLSECA
jgi:hypothetical protein